MPQIKHLFLLSLDFSLNPMGILSISTPHLFTQQLDPASTHPPPRPNRATTTTTPTNHHSLWPQHNKNVPLSYHHRWRVGSHCCRLSSPSFSGVATPTHPKLVAISNTVAFANTKAPDYPHLAQEKTWNEMTWTSGYRVYEAEPLIEWGPKGGEKIWSPTGR